MSKRALSLDDLVNHDENEQNRLRNLSQIKENETVAANNVNQSKRLSNVSDILNNSNDEDDEFNQHIMRSRSSSNASSDISASMLEPSNSDANEIIIGGTTIADKKGKTEDNQVHDYNASSINADVSALNDDSDETDTDDEINFESGMTFDYDKQDKDSPVKKQGTENGDKLKTESPPRLDFDKNSKKQNNKNYTGIDSTTAIKEHNKSNLKNSTNEIANGTAQDVSVKKELEIELKPPVTNHTKNNIKSPRLPDASTASPRLPDVSTKSPRLSEETKKSPVKSVNSIFEEKQSLISKKNNIKKDLEILSEISASSKPNKYKNVPIWAQKWKPTVNALQNIDNTNFKIDPSFLGIIPDDDLTKSVQEWIYATIFAIKPDTRQYLELEIKFGRIKESNSPDRISPPISSQAIYSENDAHLKPNIDEVLFKELISYIRGVSELNENSGKFNIIESQTRDSVYRTGLHTQRPRFLRMSTDVKTGRVGEFIEKRRVSQLLIFSPNDSYDMKISINLELPVSENDPPDKYKSQIPISSRNKDRISYIHNDSCTRIDVTKAESHDRSDKNKESEITYEVELEINTPALVKAFNNISNDSKQYAELIRTFLNNGTLIRRKLTSLSSEIFEGTKK